MSISNVAQDLRPAESDALSQAPAAKVRTPGYFSRADLGELNQRFAKAAPSEIMRFAIESADRPVVFTNFRPRAVAFLNLVTQVRPRIPVIWVDHGYNTAASYRFVEKLIHKLDLNLHVYTSQVTAARRDAIWGEIPALDTPEHDRFSREVKLEPFERALREWQPDIWLNGIRRHQTEHRKTLDIFTTGAQHTVRVAPMFHLSELDVEEYIYEQGLPDNDDYFDPTKGEEHRECGLLLSR